MSETENIRIEYQFRNIELLESTLHLPNTALPQNPTFEFDIKLELRVDAEKKLLVIACTITILTQDRDQVLGQIKANCIFHLPKLEDYIDKKTNALKVPEDFVNTLNSVSISTTRGVMFSHFRGTILHNAILPIIDPTLFKLVTKPKK